MDTFDPVPPSMKNSDNQPTRTHLIKFVSIIFYSYPLTVDGPKALILFVSIELINIVKMCELITFYYLKPIIYFIIINFTNTNLI